MTLHIRPLMLTNQICQKYFSAFLIAWRTGGVAVDGDSYTKKADKPWTCKHTDAHFETPLGKHVQTSHLIQVRQRSSNKTMISSD